MVCHSSLELLQEIDLGCWETYSKTFLLKSFTLSNQLIALVQLLFDICWYGIIIDGNDLVHHAF